MAVDARRQRLPSPDSVPAENAGLILERYLNAQGEPEAVVTLLDAVCSVTAGEAYSIAFQRWKGLDPADGCVRKQFSLSLENSLAIGLGGESALEIGFTTHRTYGMPVIPGSALKGLCRRVVASAMLSDDLQRILFGGADEEKGRVEGLAGYVTFHDAWYDPGSVNGRPFHRDVITVHHPAYYKDGSAWPTDFDDPTPVPFLVVRPGARFLFTLDAPSTEWLSYATEALQWGLTTMGVGAKTNSGYGRFARPAVPNHTEEVWLNAHVTFDPSTKTMTATGASREKAFLDRESCSAIIARLPEGVANTLTKKPRCLRNARVTVRRQGKMLTITRIEVQNSEEPN